MNHKHTQRMQVTDDEVGENTLRLLRHVNGAFRPGVLTALMGASGAGVLCVAMRQQAQRCPVGRVGLACQQQAPAWWQACLPAWRALPEAHMLACACASAPLPHTATASPGGCRQDYADGCAGGAQDGRRGERRHPRQRLPNGPAHLCARHRVRPPGSAPAPHLPAARLPHCCPARMHVRMELCSLPACQHLVAQV